MIKKPTITKPQYPSWLRASLTACSVVPTIITATMADLIFSGDVTR